MKELHLLKDLIVVTGIIIPVVLLCHRLKISSIIGFLFAGILIGPQTFRLVAEYENIHIFAEYGIVALLFTIGLEFSLQKIWNIRTIFLFGGALQVVFTCIVSAVIASLLGQPLNISIFIGFLVSLSSTALVLSAMKEHGEIDSPQGRISLAILVFQDIIVVGMILFLPLLSGKSINVYIQIIILAVKMAVVSVTIIAGARWIVPWILYRVVRTANRELFLFSILFLCLSVAFFTSSLGLSLALGAFLAGLIISESEYSHRALGSILPLKDVFSSFFFISIGMLFDVQYFFSKSLSILLIALAVMLIKAFIVGCTVMTLRWPVNTAILVGAYLSQIGEFSFILIQAGVNQGIIGEDFRQVFLGVSICTLFLTHFAVFLAPLISGIIMKLPVPGLLRHVFRKRDYPRKESILRDHLVIVGYGLVGRNLARSAKAAKISYAIVELNPDTVEQEKKKGEPIYYGDATHEAILRHVGITAARVVVIAISDPAATRSITELVKRLNPDNHIIVRTRFVSEMKELYSLGANCVIPEEFETSVEIFTRVLRHYLVPIEDIEKFIAQIRADGYRIYRTFSLETQYLADLLLSHPDIIVLPLKINRDSSINGKTLAEANVRKTHNISILAIQRGMEIVPNPSGDIQLYENDIIIVIGTMEAVGRFRVMCSLERISVMNGAATEK